MSKTKNVVVDEVEGEKVKEVVVSKIGQINVDFSREDLNGLRDKVNELIKREDER